MNPRASASAILLTILGVMMFLSVSKCQRKSVSLSEPDKPITSPPLQPNPPPSPENGEHGSKPQQLPPLFAEAREVLARSKMKRAELALQNTPEKHLAAIEAMLVHRKPHFDSLFDQWNLPSETRSAVLEVIRMRLDQRRSDSLNRSIGVAVGSPERKSRLDEINLEASLKLREILGEERSIELITLDTHLEGEVRQKLLEAARQ